MANINSDLFKRTAPKKKLEIIEKFTESELFSITSDTLLRMIKEAGDPEYGKTRSKFKTLRLCSPCPGNHWNSTIESIYNYKKDKIYLSVYIQGDDTDTYNECELSDLLNSRNIDISFGKLEESFSYDYSHTISANYSKSDRAEIIRSVCETYIKTKYSEKLKN